ncbi:MAG TPA: hypothetical protein VNK04_17190 [Gemmataceae bacterium]|nr:hypothetical protein [Gemmataceae bacterium]
MNRQRYAGLLLAAVGWLAIAPPLEGQHASGVTAAMRNHSHLLLPGGGIDPAEAERVLRERLGQAEEARQAHELIEKLLQNPNLPEEYRKTLERLRNGERDLSAIDPKVLNDIRTFAERQKKLPADQRNLPPEQLDRLEKLLQEQREDKPAARPTERRPPAAKPPPKPPSKPPPEYQPSADRLPAALEEQNDVRFRQRLLQLVERFADVPIRDSGPLRRLEEGLSRRRLRPGEDWLPFAKSRETLRAQLPQLGRSLRFDRILREGEWLFRSSPGPLDTGDWRVGRSFGGGVSSSGGLARIDAPGVGMEQGWQVLLWVGLGAVVAAAFWKIVSVHYGRFGAEGDAAWRPGRWPVDPAAVTTREELVRAFEYVTLLCLGPAARYWNHLTIADRLGDGDSAERRQAAVHLAGMYEQARYAPPEEPLPAAELEAIRRHLRFLAGASAA